MSTATANYISAPLPTGARQGSRVRSGRTAHLRLVGAVDAPQQGSRRAAAVLGRTPAHLRITRRGRLALTTTTALLLAFVVASMMGLMGPAGATSAIVVEPGMTLTQIASEHLPELPLSQAITDIQRANSLSTTSIAVGQELVIPGR